MSEPVASGTGSLADPAHQLWQQWQRGLQPDVRDFLAGAGSLTPTQAAAVLRVDQRERWQRGQRVPVETYLLYDAGVRDHEEAVLDLVYNEYVLREELGEAPVFEEYLGRFPHHRTALQRQFDLHRALSPSSVHNHGERTPVSGPPAVNGAGAIPTMIGKYRVVQVLDEGGQATVYRAVHPSLGKDVAIKLSHQPLPSDPAARDRLLAEGRILAELDHPNLARIYDLDVHDHQVYLVMEYVRGRNLEQFARQRRPAPHEAAALVAQVARALAVAHRHGIVHQDLKPQNVLLDTDGRPRVIDFGLARLQHAWTEDQLKPGSVWGTIAYMAPEQARGEVDRVGPPSDVFALGALLYFLLTGRPPFTGRDLGETLRRAQQCEWDRTALQVAAPPRRLEALCLRALAAEPADRPASAEVLATELETFARRPRLKGPLLTAAVVFVVAGLGLGWWQGYRLLKPRPDVTTDEPSRQQGSLQVRVFRQDRRFPELAHAIPLQTGDEIRIHADVPADLNAVLFLLTGDGRLRLLSERPAGSPGRPLRYPEQGDQAAPVEGHPGTEILLVCGSRSGPVEPQAVEQVLAEVTELWGGDKGWPELTGTSLFRLEHDQVVEQSILPRDLGTPKPRPDPEGDLYHRLDALRRRLVKRFDYVGGVAFAHVDAPDDD